MIKKIVEKIILKGRKIPLFNFLYEKRFVHFCSIAVMGFLINIIITIGLTELVLGREHYFFAYVVGISVNLLFNFIMHVRITFRTKKKNLIRFFQFILYSLTITIINTCLVKNLVKMTSTNYYAFIILLVTGTLFVVNFFISKHIIFFEKKKN